MPEYSNSKPGGHGPFQAPRDPKSYPSARKALLPDRQQDWIYARAQYEAGIKSVQLIASEIGVGPTAVYARVSSEGWSKDLAAREKYRTEVEVARQLDYVEKLQIEETRAVRVNAEMQAKVLVDHRQDIKQAREITMRLFAELREMMDNLPELEAFGETMRSENSRGQDRRNDIYQSVIEFTGRVDATKKLSEALKVQLQLERQAFGIQGALEDPDIPSTPQVGSSDMDKILNKFDLVLKAKGTASASSGNTLMGEVIDVPQAN